MIIKSQHILLRPVFSNTYIKQFTPKVTYKFDVTFVEQRSLFSHTQLNALGISLKEKTVEGFL